MITVALVDDYDVVLLGVARMLDGYRDRVRVVEIDANEAVDDVVDIVLYDSFAQPESDQDEIAVLVGNPRAHRVVVYTWNFHPDLIDNALRQGAHGYLSKTLTARELVLRHWRPCTPGKSWSATLRRAPAARPVWNGPAARRASPTGKRKSSP